MLNLNRREFAGVLAGGVMAGYADGAEAAPIIDTHTHFYDTSRPEGVDWPGKNDKVLYRPVLPPEFVKLTKPHGVTGTVVVEASARLEDNDWLLELAKQNPVIVGVVGNLDPTLPKFPAILKRLANSPLFRGFRINHRELAALLKSRNESDRLSLLTEEGLTLDVNGGPEGLPTLLETAKRFPKLQIVLNHNGNVRIDGRTIPADWKANITRLGEQTNVSCKMSAMVEGTGKNDGKAPTNLDFYQATLDVVWAAFGEDRLIYGSDWPVSSLFATYASVFELAEAFLKGKSAEARAKVMGKNAIKTYGLKLKS